MGRCRSLTWLASGVQTVAPGFETTKTFSAYHYDQARQEVLFATSDGTFAIVQIDYKTTFHNAIRTVVAQPKAGPFLPLGQPGFAIKHIAYADAGSQKLVAAIQDIDGTGGACSQLVATTHATRGRENYD